MKVSIQEGANNSHMIARRDTYSDIEKGWKVNLSDMNNTFNICIRLLEDDHVLVIVDGIEIIG